MQANGTMLSPDHPEAIPLMLLTSPTKKQKGKMAKIITKSQLFSYQATLPQSPARFDACQ